MKINRLNIIAALALGGLLACTTIVCAQDAPTKGKKGRPGIEQQVERLNKELNLTDEQKTKVTSLLQDEGKKRRDMRADTNLDAQQKREKMQEIRKESNAKMKAILKPDQWEKYQKMEQEMRQRKGNKGGSEKKDK